MSMKPSIIFISIFFCFAGCQSSEQNENQIIADGVKDSLIINNTRPDSDSSINRKKENWYSASYQSLCDDTKGLFLDLKKFRKYGKHNPYDTTQNILKDSTLISFDFISDCCLKYSGEALFRNDTLYLGYGLATEEARPCDCYCDYRMTYKILNRDRHWKKIIIKQGRLN
jgi:hypothetical protein